MVFDGVADGLRKTVSTRRASMARCPRGSTKQRADSARRRRGCADRRWSSLRDILRLGRSRTSAGDGGQGFVLGAETMDEQRVTAGENGGSATARTGKGKGDVLLLGADKRKMQGVAVAVQRRPAMGTVSSLLELGADPARGEQGRAKLACALDSRGSGLWT
jgi:hypothetical protein